MNTLNQTVPILLYLVAGILGAIGQYFYRWGGMQIGSVPLLKNWPIFAGFGIFCIVMVLFLAAFRLGGKLSVVYPVYATTFIWGTLLARFLAKEPVSILQVGGIATIIFGVTLVAIGTK